MRVATFKFLFLCAIPLVAAAQLPAPAQRSDNPVTHDAPWKLDLPARLERRFGPQMSGVTAGTKIREDIDGATHPELLLPWEIHRFLVATAFYRDETVAAHWRTHFSGRASGIPSNFWSEFETASGTYLKNERELGRLAAQLDHATASERDAIVVQISAIQNNQCHERMLALERANARFGEEWFQKFLYTAVAPDLKVSSTDALPPERHRFISRGCR